MKTRKLALAAILAAVTWHTFASGAEPRILPSPALDAAPATGEQVAVFSGGCFWGVQGVFEHVRGVKSAVSGYTGGSAANAYYEAVARGDTGHAESVKVTFDPAVVSYGRLLRIFFGVTADPTTSDAQGPDRGSQYRSEIWTADDDQARVATAYLAQLGSSKSFPAPIVTTVAPATSFYPAEGYHQDFLETHPDYPYIVINDRPKVRALERLYPDEYVAAAHLTDAAK
jgi:peptide-methionine (S)-S-oxide reductase